MRWTVYVARYRRDGDGWFVEVDGRPDVFSEGDTLEEARRNVREAFAAVLDVDLDQVPTLVDAVELPAFDAPPDEARAFVRELAAGLHVDQ